MGGEQGESVASACLLKVREGKAKTPCKKRLPLALGRGWRNMGGGNKGESSVLGNFH